MRKFRKKENRRIGYYAFSFNKLGEGNLLDESFIYTTTNERNTISSSKYGEFAIFNADLLKNLDKANHYFIKAIEKEPQNSFWIGNYAIFLHYYKLNFKLAEKFYLLSLKYFKDDAFVLYNYSLLLLFEKKDHKKTEIILSKAIKFDPESLRFQCTYAGFLFKIKKDYNAAEKILKKLVTKNNPQFFAVYAQFYFFQNKFYEAEILINQAFANNPSDEVSLELWFYRFAHFPQWHEKAEFEMNKLIKNNVKCLSWGLQKNVVIALFSGHPYPEKLENYSKQITGVFKV